MDEPTVIRTHEQITLLGFQAHQVNAPETTCDVHARISSVGKLIAREAWRCVSRMTPAQRTRIDVNDLTQEAWAALLEDDHRYDPARYNYVVFAQLAICRHLRRQIHKHGHTIQVPRKFLEPSSGKPPTPDDTAAYRLACNEYSPIDERSDIDLDNPTFNQVVLNEALALAS